MTQRRAVIIPSVLLSLGAVALTTPAVGDEGAKTPAPVSAPQTIRSGQHGEPVVRAIERSAHTLRSVEPEGSLRDLDALGRMVKGADVVGLGEATHGSRDFFRMKHRLFRYLVEEKGLRALSLELPWSSGVRIDDYVVNGEGSLEDIAREEFQGAYRAWHNQDYLAPWTGPANATTSSTRTPHTAPRSVRDWLDQPRVTYNIGAGWPDPTEYKIALGEAHDILVHLNEVEATAYLGTP
ncbi:hypothetical protein ACIF80_16475 [Streptomyces sp. NPDC085927]|uniref:hypothetical protein n=1 Tax=Streptomyces sp. NPDC085927 TaxID=3365738 RepID=UPI0037CD9F06